MATVIVDSKAEYIWNVSDNVLSGVLEYVMHEIDSTSPLHDLLYASKLSGNLEFHRLGEQSRASFENAVKKMHLERQSQASSAEQVDEVKKISQLVGLIDFAKSL
jgi:hypothetical protein